MSVFLVPDFALQSPFLDRSFWGGLLAGVTFVMWAYRLWIRFFLKEWLHQRALRWPVVQGTFDEGGVFVTRSGRFRKKSTYEALFGYGYGAVKGAESAGIYAFSCETQDETETVVNLLAHKTIPVRVNPDNLEESMVLDEDLGALIPPRIRPE